MPPVYRDGAVGSVTGVGYFDEYAPCRLPVDPSLRWDTRSESHPLLEILVMRVPAVDGLHGFILHDACWDILQKAGEPEGLSFDRLVSICESVPFPLISYELNWGHEYEGFLKRDTDGAYPWSERFSLSSLEDDYNLGAMDDLSDGCDIPSVLSTAKPCHPEISSWAAGHADPFLWSYSR